MFEAEVLLELMFRYWDHPLADDAEFRNDNLEKAAQVLIDAKDGVAVMKEVSAQEMNFIAAVWYVEWATVESAWAGMTDEQRIARREWLNRIRHVFPSCFCDQSRLT